MRRFFVDIPHIDWVGNLELAFNKSNTYKSLKRMKEQLKENTEMSLVVRNSSCTLAMSLTLMHLRRNGYKIIDLNNAGQIGGCMCYSNAASVNDMISIFGNSTQGLMELLFDENPFYQFKVFNRNDCLRTTSQYAFDGNMYFIDIPSAVCLFTKHKERSQLRVAEEEDDDKEDENDNESENDEDEYGDDYGDDDDDDDGRDKNNRNEEKIYQARRGGMKRERDWTPDNL